MPDPHEGSDTDIPDNDAQSKNPVKKHGIGRFLVWTFGLLIGLPLLTALVLTGMALVFRSDPAAHVPEGFDAYASMPSASAFITGALHLKALDAALSTPETASLRGTVRSLRANPVLRSPLFLRLANVRIDAAVYPEGGFVLAADLGLRSAATRLAPFAIRLFPGLLAKVEGLSYEADAFPPRFVYENGDLTLYALLYRNVLVVASSTEFLLAAARPGDMGPRKELAKALGSKGDGSLRFLAEPGRWVESLSGRDDPLGRLFNELAFPSLSVVDLTLRDERISVSLDLPWSADDSLRPLLDRRSRTPAALTRIPASASYFSLLAAGKPAELWDGAAAILGPDARKAFSGADEASKLAFGLGLNKLLFSWMGEEFGVFGSDRGPAPVFFASVGDERARKDVFEKAFGSLLVGRDLSAVVDGTRVPRIVFPRWLRTFLESIGINLVEPFYLVHDGFLYASSSAEVLAFCVAEVRGGELLVKSDRWKETASAISPESSVMVYYTLDRSAPFFLRGSEGVTQALKLYRRGVASLKLVAGSMRLELSAVSAVSPGLTEIPGYPVKEPGRVDSDPLVGSSPNGTPMAFWTSGRTVRSMDLSTGISKELQLDDKAWIALDTQDGRIAALWAISGRGTVYRTDADLEPMEGFPLVTGQTVTGPSSLSAERLLVPVADESALMIVTPAGQTSFSASLGAKARSAPAVSSWGIAVLPRSFEGNLYLLDLTGALVPGWPAYLSGIAGAAPIFAGADSPAAGMVAAVTEEGQIAAFLADGSPAPGFPTRLYGVFDSALAWAPGWRSFFLVSAEG
ncbi:MAG: hypothetical protein E4H20_03640, partial [Spirochaetales bacterium]